MFVTDVFRGPNFTVSNSFVGYRGEIRKSCEDPVDCYASADMNVSEIFILGYMKNFKEMFVRHQIIA